MSAFPLTRSSLPAGAITRATLALGCFALTVQPLHGQALHEVVTAFERPYYDGDAPSALIQTTDGSLVGLTTGGGSSGVGTVFKVTVTGRFSVVYRFTGHADGGGPTGLIQTSDGTLAGTTGSGGDLGGGTAFTIDSAGTLTTIHHFRPATEGAAPTGILQGSDGSFYGTTRWGGPSGNGTIFRLSAAGALTVLHAFDGSQNGHQASPLIQASDGALYGTTQLVNGQGIRGEATIFKADTAGGFVTLTTFLVTASSTGAGEPMPRLVQATDGYMYGTTFKGGTADAGAIFRIDTAGHMAVVYSFGGGAVGAGPRGSLTQALDGRLYGTAYCGGASCIYAVDGAGHLTVVHAFETERVVGGVLATSDGLLYGMMEPRYTPSEPYDAGSVFRLSPSSAVTTVHQFRTGTGPAYPGSQVIEGPDGRLYGTTSQGGAYAEGTVFSATRTGAVTTLHSFSPSGDDGFAPRSALFAATNGRFYGTTHSTVFSIDSSGAFHASPGNDGYDPIGGVIQATDGNFYGTASQHGPGGGGTVFKMDAAGAFTTLYAFAWGPDGALPYAGLVQGADGNLYGTTFEAGAHKLGTIFRVTLAGTLTTLHSFAGSDGAHPSARLIQSADGGLYGTTTGLAGRGTIFRLDPSGTVTVLYKFTKASKGKLPYGSLLQAADGALYGTTATGGAYGAGTAFRLDPSGRLDTLYNFTGINDGGGPVSGLIQASDGMLYGTTPSGGPAGGGTIYRLSIQPANLTLADTEVAGCLKTTATVTLASPAPPGGLVVSLSSTNPHAVPPATTTVAKGKTTRKFTILTSPVAATESGVITATIFGVSGPGQSLTLRPIAPRSVSLSSTRAVGGTPVSGSVLLQCAAGPTDITVTLSSSQPAAARPVAGSVVVPRGASSASFSLSTFPVTGTTRAIISAATESGTASKTLTVAAPPKK